MRLTLKFADTGMMFSTLTDPDKSAGDLAGVPFVMVTATKSALRSGILTDDVTAWDWMYKRLTKINIASKVSIPLYFPTTDGIQKIVASPGVYTFLGATASGKTKTMLEGVGPFLRQTPTSDNVTLTYGEDRVPYGIKMSQPEELFYEMASHVLKQMVSFFLLDGEQIDIGNKDHISALNKRYTEKEFSEKFTLSVTPLPRVMTIESIRDFVYSQGVQGKAGFNMRITIELVHMRLLFEDLNIYMLLTVNPMIAISEKEKLKDLASDFDASSTGTFLQLPSVAREKTPKVITFGRGNANPDRSSDELTMRNLIEHPVTDAEIAEQFVRLEDEDINNDVDDVETEVEYNYSDLSNSVALRSTKASKLYSQNMNSQSDVFLSETLPQILADQGDQ